MVWNSSRPSASNHAMWNMHNWDSATTDSYHLTAVARTAAFCHNDDLYRCLDGRNWKRYAADMPCVCRNGHIIRCAEGNRASRNVQKTILHLTALKTVHENAEALQLGTHVHACQRHTIPRLLLELAFVDPPAVDGRQTIDDASADCEFRVGGKFRETNRGYGKLSSWNRIAERANTTLIAASGSHVRASNGSVRIDGEHSRRLPVRYAHHRIDFDRRAQFGGQHVFALH